MNITRVVVRPVEREDKVKAMASITIDDSFAVHGLRVVDGEKGLFVAMPSRRLASGEYRDIAHPINTETREMIQKAVLEEYKRATSGASSQEEATPLMEEETLTEEASEEESAGEEVKEESLEEAKEKEETPEEESSAESSEKEE